MIRDEAKRRNVWSENVLRFRTTLNRRLVVTHGGEQMKKGGEEKTLHGSLHTRNVEEVAIATTRLLTLV